MPPVPTTTELELEEGPARVDALTREILNDDYTHFGIERVDVSEIVSEGMVSIKVALARSGNEGGVELSGRGVGIVDAFFDGMMNVFSEEYPSLKAISVDDFKVETFFENAHGRRSDAEARASLKVINSAKKEFIFRARSPSVTRSSVLAALSALTFFMNSEKAYVRLHLALEDAKSRRRSDLVERYRSQMGVLVDATSYSEVIERLREST